jgi:hypothetical protein
VVLLVDEYDKAIISHLGKGEAELEIAKKKPQCPEGVFRCTQGTVRLRDSTLCFFDRNYP